VIGITLALLLTATVRMPRGLVAWSIGGDLAGGLLLLPTGTASSGLYDTTFPATVRLFSVGVAACPPHRWRGPVVAGLVIAELTAAILWIEAAFPSPSDPNLALKVNEHLLGRRRVDLLGVIRVLHPEAPGSRRPGYGRLAAPPRPAPSERASTHWGRLSMLAFTAFGTKEIIVYIVVLIVIIAAIFWFVSRGKAKS
jgi:hypothetical protein